MLRNGRQTKRLAARAENLLHFRHSYPKSEPTRTHTIVLFQLKSRHSANTQNHLHLIRHLLRVTWNYYRYSSNLCILQCWPHSKTLWLDLKDLSRKVLYRRQAIHKIQALRICKSLRKITNEKRVLFHSCAWKLKIASIYAFTSSFLLYRPSSWFVTPLCHCHF